MARWSDAWAHRAARSLATLAAAVPRDPVFVIGSGRSGTSMLRRLLSEHPDLAVFPSEANRLWHPNAYPWHSKRIEVPVFWSNPRHFTHASRSSTTDRQRRRLRSTFGHFQRLRGAPTFVNKSAMIHFMLDEIVQLFPEARFVHVVRDGRAVSLSWQQRVRRLDAERGGGPVDHMDDHELLQRLMQYWTDSVHEVDTQVERLGLGDGRFLELGYEALCASPDETLARLADFLSVDASLLRQGGPPEYANQNTKAASLTPEVLRSLTHIGSSALQSRGYSLDTVGLEPRRSVS